MEKKSFEIACKLQSDIKEIKIALDRTKNQILGVKKAIYNKNVFSVSVPMSDCHFSIPYKECGFLKYLGAVYKRLYEQLRHKEAEFKKLK